MRILVITEYLCSTCSNGSEVFARELITELKKIHSITVLAHETDNDLAWLDIPIPANVYADVDRLKEFLYAHVHPEEYDLVYNLGGLLFGCFIVNYLNPVIAHIPLVNHFQLLFPAFAEKEKMSSAKQELLSRQQLETMSKASLNIFISVNELHEAIRYQFPVKKTSVAVIHNGIRAAAGTPHTNFKVPLINGKKPMVFLAAGRFSDHVKGADIAFRAFKRLLQDTTDIYLLAIGPSVKYQNILAGVPEQHYCLMDWMEREALLGLLPVADAVLVPSRYEPFGMIALEAMLQGIPVIGNDTGGLSEIIHHNRTGLLNPVRNGWLGFYRCMLEFYAGEGLRSAMGEAARQSVLKKFMIEDIAEQADQHLCRAVLSHRTLEEIPVYEQQNLHNEPARSI